MKKTLQVLAALVFCVTLVSQTAHLAEAATIDSIQKPEVSLRVIKDPGGVGN